MRLQLLPVAALAALCVPPMPAQQSVCDLFKDLKSHDGEHIVVRGELFLDGEQAAIGAVSCETRYISEHRLWPTAIELSPSSLAPPSQLAELRKQAIRMQKLDLNGQTIAAYGTFTGRLTLQSDSGVPARLIFDDARDITVEALPEASKLSVIPICDLFRDLPKYKDQRIAVRADFVATDEGAWLSGRCKGDFVTDGYRWPVSLWYGQPDYFGAQPFSLFRIDLSKTVPSSPAAPDLQGRQNVTTTATFVGRLHMRDKYVVRCTPEGRYVGYGFGHLSR